MFLMDNNSTLDNFCGSTFWNNTLTWNTDSPDFTRCFQKTVLVWIPCTYLWLVALLEINSICQSKGRDIPWNRLNISKLAITGLLVLLQMINFGHVIYLSLHDKKKVYDADYYEPIVKILTFTVAASLLYYNKEYGRRTSGVLFLFWLLLLFGGLPQLRSELMQSNEPNEQSSRYKCASYIIYYSMIFIMFVLNCFADLPPRYTPYQFDENQSPEHSAGFPSRLTFSWFDPLAVTGFRRSLVEDDLWSLNPELTSKQTVLTFEKIWERSRRKRDACNTADSDASADTITSTGRTTSVLTIICVAFGPQFLFAIFLKIIIDLFRFTSPQLLSLLIGFISGNEPVWRGYLYAGTMFVCAVTQTLLLGQYFLRTSVVGIKIKSALSSVIYKKALKLSNAARKETTMGQIINLMSTDVDRFSQLMFLNLIWSAPLQISLSLYFLWGVLGPSVLAGLAVIAILMPLNGVVARFEDKLQNKLMRYKDERMKLMNELFNGIKVLKMYAWEVGFQDHITQIRDKEMAISKKLAYYNSVTEFVWFCTPFLVSLMSFMCFVLVNDKEVLDPQRTFVALSLFNILHFPISMLPNVISDIIQLGVSVKRLNKFLNAEELDPIVIEHNPDEPDQIVIENGNFTWNGKDAEPVLKNININVPEGSLVAIVGTVGAGKSSLLSALLGDMDKLSGRVCIKGNIAYVSQQAWIQNATIQNNIMFGNAYDKNKYSSIVNACALTPDFSILPAGDQTEIGEKGVNLSGGQKQRISLARAVYHDADNYFLDDPLSAVDVHVGRHIFEKVIGPSGLLKTKTRMWVTNNVSYLSQTDMILVLCNGEVSEAGSYQQLIDKKGDFAEFLLQYLTIAEQKGSTEELKLIQHDLESKLGTDFERKLLFARSLSRGDSVPETKGAGDFTNIPQKEELNDNEEYIDDGEADQFIETETTETGEVKWAVYKYYLRNVGFLAAIATVMVYITLHMLSVGANFWLAKWSSDENLLVNGTVNTKLRDMYLGVYGAFGIGQAFASFFSDLLPFLACWRAAKILHTVLLDNVIRAPMQFFEVTPVGRILSRFSRDVAMVDSSISWQIASVMNSAFEPTKPIGKSATVISTIFVISYTTPMFMVVIVPIALLYYLIQRFYVPTSRQLMRIESVASSPVYSHFSESLMGATSIRAFGVMDRFIDESQHRVDHYHSLYYLSAIADRWLSVRLETIGGFAIFFAALFAVIGRENISPGLAGLSVTYTLEITQTLSWLVQMASSIETDIVSVERIKEYAEAKREAAWIIEPGPRSSWPETGQLQLEGLSLAYREDSEPVLRSITCSVPPRAKVGIVGRTGAGKSTLTLGLFRMVEAVAGRILIDGIDIATLGLKQLRARITLIPQDPMLFAGSLRSNLDPIDGHSDDEVWRAVEHAHLRPYVEGLEAGLQHEVSEGGENLSVGQRQLVCLARALLRNTSLLVLDEATAAVDLETDELIQKTIRSEFAECTVLTIAHRLNTIMDSTMVMVLDKGQLVEYAPPEELLEDKNSMFYHMASDAGLIS